MEIMKQHLNLLPWRLRCRMLLRERSRQWAMAWTVMTVVTLTLYGGYWRKLAESQQDLEVWQRRAAAVQAVDQKNQRLRLQIAGMQNRLMEYGYLESEQLGYQLIARTSQSSRQSGGKIQIQKLSFKAFQVPETVTPGPTPVPAPAGAAKVVSMRDVRTLSLTGVAPNNLVVAQFVSSLRDSGAFHNVNLKSTQGHTAAAFGARNFQVECSF
jgi:type IV pilus assembly PilN-like protein